MDSDSKPGLIDRLTALLLREPGDRGQLAEILRGAYERNLMDADALAIIEGALAASETRVIDVMVPRALMDVVDINEPMTRIIPAVIEAAHSRFPVIQDTLDNVLGVVRTKDLLGQRLAGQDLRPLQGLDALPAGDPLGGRAAEWQVGVLGAAR